ncbi:MAG: glycosyltransferase family 4 protein [Ignavibacteriae bacterium]|nr:glycosyltransferase family 4 protein [Ignavibacteriota bacterium]
MFNVLVIAYYYPPLGLSGVQRTLKFTKHMQQFGWKPTIITTGKMAYFAHDISLLQEAEKANIEIIRTESLDPSSLLKKKGTVKMPSSLIMKLFSRISKTIFIPDNKIFWSGKAIRVARKILKKKKYDAIYVSAPPFSTIEKASKLKKEFNIPLFVDYRDAWLTNQFRFYPTPFHKYMNKRLEDKTLRNVDRTLVVNRAVKEDLLNEYKFLSFKDVEILTHGFDPDDFAGIEPLPRTNNKLIIMYSGIFYEGITPKYILKAFKKLALEYPDVASNIELHFVGHFKSENRRIVKRLKLQSFVKEIGYLRHTDSVKRIISSDVLWLMLPNEERMNNVTPGKIYEYFGTQKPILACLPEGISKSIISDYKASFITKPNDVNEIKNAILEIHKLFIANNLPKPNEEFVDKFNRIKLTKDLTKIFQFYLKAE